MVTVPSGRIAESLWIDNIRSTASGEEWLAVDDAYTEEEFAWVRSGTAADVDRAFASARRAQPEWAATPVEDRVRILNRAADILEAGSKALADTLTAEVGTPQRQVGPMQVGAGLAAIRLTTASAAEVVGERRSIGASTVIREPAGVVGAITPWNYPVFQVALKIAPALAAGCSVVLKPPSVAPLTAFAIAEALSEAGLPPGVLNIVCGSGSVVGAAIAGHADADFISFTGSVGAGRQVARSAAQNGTRTSLELGGKSAALLVDDDLLDDAITHTVASCFSNAGQTCAALSRLVVPRRLLAEAEAIVKQRVDAYVIGDPRSADTTLGPLSNRGQRDSVLADIDEAIRAQGVRLVAGGGGDLPAHGWFAPATAFVADDPAAAIVQHEVFGPVLTIQPYDDLPEAVRLVNDTPFGLIARVWTSESSTFEQIAGSLRVGGVIQSGTDTVWDAPFGGVKASGYGRERGPFGVEEYLVPKSLQTMR